MTHLFTSFLITPIGVLSITANKHAITAISFLENEHYYLEHTRNDISEYGKRQLQAYFKKERQAFELPLQLSGTDFQNSVWKALQDIPFGKTISYLQLAQNLGDPKCIRAAGMANGKNPFAIAVPCHRVIGSNGNLVGYAGGLWRKRWLLEHEQQLPRQFYLF